MELTCLKENPWSTTHLQSDAPLVRGITDYYYEDWSGHWNLIAVDEEGTWYTWGCGHCSCYWPLEIPKSGRIWQLRTRANKLWIKYNLDIEYILWLYEFQKWNCFYSDIKLLIKAWWGKNKDSLSFDKIIPELWYAKWNVVLCTTQVNTCKNDITLDEMEKWMPWWYKRVQMWRDCGLQTFQVNYWNF